MTSTRQYLLEAQRIHLRLKLQQERLLSWQEMATSITAQIGTIGTTPTKRTDKLEKCVEEIILLQDKIQDEILRLTDLESEIQTIFSKIENPTVRTLMEMKYLNGYSLADVAAEMNYSYVWVSQLHKKGLEATNSIRKFM